MRLRTLDAAETDLVEGFRFYEQQEAGLGLYFLDALFMDIDSLVAHAGVHEMIHGYFRQLSRKFPFAIYYKVERKDIRVYAVLDCRRSPSWTRSRLK